MLHSHDMDFYKSRIRHHTYSPIVISDLIFPPGGPGSGMAVSCSVDLVLHIQTGYYGPVTDTKCGHPILIESGADVNDCVTERKSS